ncbi:hypothetical protein WA026_007949 [Henosepilachna vigintioctopunctata]|uniref:Peptidase M13 N-terminal domain-containing protein n=1 Tax=Henosepilachna vigintioctopunctata TaxID=420089 RepID=A0AAW1TKH7_9CUCU
MTRQTYEVCSPHIGVLPERTPDSSFKTCLCTMLVVLVICILLFLMAFGFQTFVASKEKDNIASDALRNQNRLNSTVIPNNTQIINDTTVTQKPSNFDIEKPTTTYEEPTAIGENTTQVDTEEPQTTDQESTTQTSTSINPEEVTETQTTTIAAQITTQSNFSSTNATTVKSKKIFSDDIISENDNGLTTEPNSKIEIKTKRECNSAVCTSTAARMIASMDLTQKPCENFYEYACGGVSGYKEKGFNVFSEKVREQTDTPNFIKQFNMFYTSCLEHEDRFHYQERVKKVKDLLNSVGSYQMENVGYSQNNLTKFVADLILFGKMPFFDVEVDIDPRNKTYILKLLKPDRTSLDLDHWSSFSEEKRKCIRKIEESESKLPPDISMVYKNMIRCQSEYSGFFDSIKTTMMELGFFSNLTEKIQQGHIFEIKQMIELNILMTIDSTMNVSFVQEEILSKKYISMSIKELGKKFPQIEWSKLFKLISNLDEDNDMKIFLHDIEYFEQVFDVLETADIKTLNNALLVMLADSLFQNTVVPIHRHSRSKYCREVSQKLMPDITNYIYQLNNYNEEMVKSTAVVKDIFEKLKNRFKKSLEGRNWLDEFSKNSIIQKVDDLELVFTSSNLTSEKFALENAYNNLILDKGNYQANLFNLIKYSKRRLLSLYAQKVTPENMYRNFVDISSGNPTFSTRVILFVYLRD